MFGVKISKLLTTKQENFYTFTPSFHLVVRYGRCCICTMSLRRLKHHEKKLLKKVDFLWQRENNLREIQVMRRYRIRSSWPPDLPFAAGAQSSHTAASKSPIFDTQIPGGRAHYTRRRKPNAFRSPAWLTSLLASRVQSVRPGRRALHIHTCPVDICLESGSCSA